MPIIAPSLLSADFLHLQEAADLVNRSEAAWLHLDVMDGRLSQTLASDYLLSQP